MLTRREFSRNLLAGGAALLTSSNPSAAGKPVSPPQSSNQDCDLLIKGGTVIDPGQHLHAPLDVAVKNGKILEVSKNIPETGARQVVSAKDKIVTPGFIDLHLHCFEGLYEHGINADHYCLGRGVTTCVDAGSTGYFMIRRFVKDIVNTSTTRVYPLVHIAMMGNVVDGEHRYQNLDWVNPELTAKTAEENRPAVVGIKVHLEGKENWPRGDPKDLELVLFKRALEAAEASHLPLMVHASESYYPWPEILKMMRKGDVLTHCFNNNKKSRQHPDSLEHNILDPSGKILPEVREARERGIFFDTGDGNRNVDFDLAEKALHQDFLPDSISTDLDTGIENDLIYDLPTSVSRFMALGIDLDKAIERVTIKPAQVFDYGAQIGTLRPGNEADIGIFELHEGKFEFLDRKGDKRTGHQMLVNRGVVCRGQLIMNLA